MRNPRCKCGRIIALALAVMLAGCREPTNQSVLAATKKAFQIHEYAFHIDPFELLIDANICDAKCEAKA